LRTMVGGLAAGVAVRTWPFRVYSFPSDIVLPRVADISETELRFWDHEVELTMGEILRFWHSTGDLLGPKQSFKFKIDPTLCSHWMLRKAEQ
jgi:hypothetical protein